MSLFGTPSAYQPNNAAPWANGIRTIGSALAMKPVFEARARQQAEQMQMREQLNQAQIGETQAKTRLTTAQASEAEGDNSNDAQLATALKRLTVNPADTDAQGDAIAGFGRAYKKNPEGTAKALGQLFAQFQARTGGTNFANMGALQGDAASIANNQADNDAAASRPMHVSAGGVVFDPQTRKPIFTNPSAAALEQAYQTTTEEIPAVEGQPADVTPAYEPGAIKRFFGAEPRPAVTNAPAIPAQPEKKITRRVPISAAVQQPAPAAQTNAPAPAGGKVRVKHPQGGFGYIPAEQVQDALSQGYTLAPK